MRTPMVPQPPSPFDTAHGLRDPVELESYPQPVETRVISGLHCIDDLRARGWRLLSMDNEGHEPVAVMVRVRP
jgi:hypothetical protein